ncbi:hypothetical protein [Rhodococcus jostii]|uniref:Integral membrane protein n=1 Tax=Rhodococcus jostii TaxID=132919 RepID=A0A1H5FQC9_RHOJO|nr:hypothetical protein [Rhodococcus jostii]SEE05344.1 hypothetical protein SAMN04490220_6487 [Rhodococcus jostii]
MTTMRRRVTERKHGPLPAARASARLSAYVYGNILVLTVVVAATPRTIENGAAVALVLGTTVTTFLAHVFADAVAHGSVPVDDDAEPAERSSNALDELRDAVPIVSSGTGPAALLALGWLHVLPTAWAQLLAGGVIVFRISTIQIVTERVRGNRLTLRLLIVGLATAALAAAIVIAKVLVGH